MLQLIFLLIAAVLAALATLGVPAARINLLAGAFFFYLLAVLVPVVGHL